MIKNVFRFLYENMATCFGLLVLIAMVVVMIFICIESKNMQDNKERKIANNAYNQGYIDACKDFYQCKLKYDLVKHADGTITWEKVR